MNNCYNCGFFEDDIGCFNLSVDNVDKCSLNRPSYPSYLDCYNCTDICSDCPITRKE